MEFDRNSRLWPNSEDSFFTDNDFHVIQQIGNTCVSTSLAILTGGEPKRFQDCVNTQDPISWSDKIRESGMQFAYCPTDARKLGCYIEELITLDDLFTLSFYTEGPDEILGDPRSDGWVCGSHIVVMHRDKILDPQSGTVSDADKHSCKNRHTKRVFRVVPSDYYRRL